jgi:oligosaccharide repeat unit polymerase
MVILLLYFIALLSFLFLYDCKPSLGIVFVLLQIGSLLGAYLIGKEFQIQSARDVINILITIFMLTMVIIPWMKSSKIYDIYCTNENKLKKLTIFLLILSAYAFFVFLIVTLIVFNTVDNINEFKYGDENSAKTNEFYQNLFLNFKVIVYARYLYLFSYFLIPLHFYYLYKQKKVLSVLCFIFSLAFVLQGLSYFSRVFVLVYILTYISFMCILYNIMNIKMKKNIKKIVVILIILISIYFIGVSVNRFRNNVNISYSSSIPVKSKIKDILLFSYFDYLSQWFYNGMYVLNDFKSETFRGQVSLERLLYLLDRFNIVRWDHEELTLLRRQLWPKNHWTFQGLVAYSIYDYGYLGAFVFALTYYTLVRRFTRRIKNNRISILNLFYLVLFVQIPLFAIFYSSVSGIIVPLILLIPIVFYMRVKIW